MSDQFDFSESQDSPLARRKRFMTGIAVVAILGALLTVVAAAGSVGYYVTRSKEPERKKSAPIAEAPISKAGTVTPKQETKSPPKQEPTAEPKQKIEPPQPEPEMPEPKAVPAQETATDLMNKGKAVLASREHVLQREKTSFTAEGLFRQAIAVCKKDDDLLKADLYMWVALAREAAMNYGKTGKKSWRDEESRRLFRGGLLAAAMSDKQIYTRENQIRAEYQAGFLSNFAGGKKAP